jgi:hypothetical protein
MEIDNQFDHLGPVVRKAFKVAIHRLTRYPPDKI